jgi:hypothetical protein
MMIGLTLLKSITTLERFSHILIDSKMSHSTIVIYQYIILSWMY